ncbi:MAG: YafY family transcriptional regulator [Proteobacteria bacterium]|nr:YafY family transcriptional regulator [Pseudomonadota bacterium]
MRKADRLFQLTNLIRAKQPITAQRLAEELNVAVRTIYRYIDDLSVSGIPIYGTTGVGYQLDEHFELPPLNLTEKELDALLLGVKMVSSWTGNTLSEAASSLASKIEVVLPTRLKQGYVKTIYAPDFLHSAKDRKIWELIYKAIKNSNSVSINYTALNNNITNRTIYPLGLFYWGGKWTLGSWCTLRNDFRNFRIDKMSEIKVSKEQYSKTTVINLQSYFATIDDFAKQLTTRCQ